MTAPQHVLSALELFQWLMSLPDKLTIEFRTQTDYSIPRYSVSFELRGVACWVYYGDTRLDALRKAYNELPIKAQFALQTSEKP